MCDKQKFFVNQDKVQLFGAVGFQAS